MIKRNKLKVILQSIAVFILLGCSFTSCKKFLPSDRDSLGTDSQFTQLEYNPVLGRNNLMNNNFNAGNASQPLTFKIVGVRRANGDPAPELTQNFPVKIWNKPYLGTETSLAEIEAKRTINYYPLLNIRAHNGAVEMWAESRSSFIRTAPDQGYLFDVEVSNSGGTRYFTNMILKPMKERAYEPSNYDPITGTATVPYVRPTAVNNIRGAKTSSYLTQADVEVYFRKVVNDKGEAIGNGNSITMIFKDSLNNYINPALFNKTDWPNLIHGFDMVKTNQHVKYNVAFPIPLIAYKTRYTNGDGSRARIALKYDRFGFGGIREESSLEFDFAIFEKGDWEVIFRFSRETPKFEND